MEIKRYNVYLNQGRPKDEGVWVKYQDHIDTISKHEDRRHHLEREMYILEKRFISAQKGIKLQNWVILNLSFCILTLVFALAGKEHIVTTISQYL